VNPRQSDLLKANRRAISQGSKSFSWASLIFRRQTKEQAWALYRWCRFCDDEIDTAKSPAEARRRLRTLRAQTFAAFLSPQDPALRRSEVFDSLREVVGAAQIPLQYAEDLLRGFEMDVECTSFRTEADLSFYAYGVAGTVGLMMSHIMGLRTDTALEAAVRMGIAMQLTNIARDIREDYDSGRCYLPDNWLRNEGLARETFFESLNREALWRVVEKLLGRADSYYSRGLAGLRALDFRSAWAVRSAMLIYRDIGRTLLQRGPTALDSRVYTTRWRKVRLCGQALGQELRDLPFRLLHPWKAQPILRIWTWTPTSF
jgi:phytoene synthase